MDKEKASQRKAWSVEEEKLVCFHFFDVEYGGEEKDIVGLCRKMADKGFGDRKPRAVRAKYSDFKKIDLDVEYSHVCARTIQVYEEIFPYYKVSFGLKVSNRYPNDGKNYTVPLEENGFSSLTFDNQKQLGSSSLGLLTVSKAPAKSSFQEILEDLIEKAELRFGGGGEKWGTIYHNAGVNSTTANEIRQGRRIQAKDGTAYNLYRLLIVLRASYEDVCEIHKSIRMGFSDSTWTDIIIEECFKQKVYNRREINETLVAHKEPKLFINV